MLSYQHIYHAGNLADVQKHALLAWMLDYLTRKDKPLSYIETHSGRGLYDLSADEAIKTGEAAQGIAKVAKWFAPGHPYMRALAEVRKAHGPNAYPGSPVIAKALLRDTDTLHLAELHPQEHAALRTAMRIKSANTYQQDGWDMVQSICPPTPRRGLLLVDPSYEIKTDYDLIPKVFQQLDRKWNVGILALWYPLLKDGPHGPMIRALQAEFPDALKHEVRFPPARDGHRMIGSGMFIVNPPYGLSEEAARLTKNFAQLSA
ncbi:23S rRNA (adenine(2030)-N(6))-methyltransferase RlmJ [Pseudoprimorskyibacter insulae]|uniref:Ribosomal RNA large subunit methyltransferase J n=1 Tax=Pseudoprimorskyibacter insulae TaxID=1695997 RepID=A0A2R8AYE2_9RHOB|nr:23S rRNA (adenine(2030)-N(6))-methyltransferase RlmJ [Pseudoprimorskyibacter insulae]SPF81046.1 Ribosomal RNA large subunit methyltransferase J [Pseudoprimorskyibacter insulae]